MTTISETKLEFNGLTKNSYLRIGAIKPSETTLLSFRHSFKIVVVVTIVNFIMKMCSMRNLYLLAMFCFFSLSSCKKKEVLDDCLNTGPWYQKDVKLVFKSNLPGLADNVNYFVKEVNKSRVRVIDDIGIFVPIGHLRICDKKLYKASSLQYTDEQVFYDLNGSVGDKWIVETEEFGNRIVDTITLKEKNISLSVPNGTFETTIFLLEGFRNYPYSMKLYVTNDHGPVKLAGRSADLEFDLELSDRNF